jgi:hypothetical protein
VNGVRWLRMSHKETLGTIIGIIIALAVFAGIGLLASLDESGIASIILGILFWLWIIYLIIDYFSNRGKRKELEEERRDYKRISDNELKECNMERRFPLLSKELKEKAWEKESKDFKTLKKGEWEKLGDNKLKKRFPTLFEKIEEKNRKSPLYKEAEKFDALSYKERKNYFTNLDYNMSKKFPLLAKNYEKEFGFNERAKKEIIKYGKLSKDEQKKCDIQKEFPEFYKIIIKDLDEEDKKNIKNKIKEFVFGKK